ncbi:MAG TPA: pyridoxal-phosphate dependent enzyme [Candidatus Saccharimonadales bacterium]|nr:pyridoxal-phosphate dependent enzyme [Candidatus Saccharimonadales bacterium]
MNNEYYSGPEAVTHYLRPDPDKYIPLVELPESLNPYLKKYNIHIDAKLMNTLPLGNVKSLPAWQMLQDGGELSGLSLVEASSGNTVFSLGLLAQYFGVKSVRAIASPEVSDGKLDLLQLAGVNVKLVEGPICPNPDDPEGAIATAYQEGSKPGFVNLGQYDNDSNPAAHEKITGPQLFSQLGKDIGMFCAGLGTTGTLLGTSRYLHKKIPNLKVAGVVRMPNNPVPGVRTTRGLNEVAFPWSKVLTEPLMEIDEKEAYKTSLSLIRTGLLVGPSSGFVFAGVMRHLKRLEKNNEIESLRGKHVVFVCPDTPFPYVAEYKKVLGSAHFPVIENSQLRDKAAISEQTSITLVPELDVKAVRGLYDSDTSTAKDTVLIDVREPNEFADHHLPGSINIPLSELPSWIKTRNDHDPSRVIFICRSGNRSAKATYLAKQMDINAYNMKGGTVEWSAQNYPRIKDPYCVTEIIPSQ